MKLPKVIDFPEYRRAEIEFSGPEIRLDPRTSTIQLKYGETGYPTTGVHWALSPMFAPERLRQFLGFHSEHQQILDDERNLLTDVEFTIYDVEDDMDWFWDGTAWEESSLGGGEWSSEEDLADNLSTFISAVGNKTEFRLRVRLSTTDQTVTPIFTQAMIAYEAELGSLMEEYLYRGIGRAVRDAVRATDIFHWDADGTTSINFAAIVTESQTPFEITGVVGVYDHTDDPNHFTNLLASYSNGTITLASAPEDGHKVFIEGEFAPQVAVSVTSQDYEEVEKIPCISLRDFRMIEAQIPRDFPVAVLNRAAGTALIWPAPVKVTIDFEAWIMAPSGVVLTRLLEKLNHFFRNNAVSRSPGIGEPFEFKVARSAGRNATTPTQSGVHTAVLNVMAEVVYLYADPSTSEASGVYPVTKLVLSGNLEGETPDPVI